ncbi:MAG TPA: S46 family peptidase, partial [Bacteroidales bacterium]|nr:S46 family peptidase [Bacteroidales bacterium]
RLVGAPPSSVGNFGRDNDNWMWPRHTGDFSMFRVYADANNKPAEYSEDNVPYSPRKFFEISTDGIQEGDFTMLLGYPGSTEQFLYSKALENMMNRSLPLKIDLRTQRLAVMDKYMKTSDKVRIQYASKYRGVSNAWKKWQGVIKGLERMNALQRKLDYEKRIKDWVSKNDSRKEKYQFVFDDFDDIYSEMTEFQKVYDLMAEAIFAVESFGMMKRIESYVKDTVSEQDFRNRLDNMYKNYHMPIDRDMLAVMLRNYRENAPDSYMPEVFNVIDNKFKGDEKAYAYKAFNKSFIQSRESIDKLVEIYIKNPKRALRKLSKDPILLCVNEFHEIFSDIRPSISMAYNSLDHLYKTYVQAIFEFEPDVIHYPDANFTMRLTYGQVEGYEPRDAVIYDYYTTLSGVIEKSKEGKHDYVISDKLLGLYKTKNYGDFGVNDTMKVCFTASNHTSGGNSGSPVIDANGRLIGINFDRNWHGTMSDEMYDPDMCRNISVDIRYILFIIDKYADAGYLLDEMVLVD